MLQKTLDPFQRPRIGPFSGSLRECIRCFTRRNFGKAQSRSRTDPRPCQFSEILRGDRGIFQACPASSDRPRVTSKRRQFKRSPNLINNRRRKISTPEKRKLPDQRLNHPFPERLVVRPIRGIPLHCSCLGRQRTSPDRPGRVSRSNRLQNRF